MDKNNFYEQRNNQNIIKLRIIRAELPDFAEEFFRAIEMQSTTLTRLNYAYDLRIFFDFVINNLLEFKNISHPKEFTIADLARITTDHLEIFLEYLNYYKFKGNTYRNGERAKARKLSAVRSFFKYYYNKGAINYDAAAKVRLPKIHNKEIVRLEVDEVVRLLNEVEAGDTLTLKQKYYHDITKLRDLAMMSLFLGTGIRISECVGLNIDDLDFAVNGFRVVRKGGNRVILYYSDEVADVLKEYLQWRKNLKDVPPDEKALFLSLQNKRISVRTVQMLVKKYSELVTPLKNITPHKLRSTYGTNLYRETKDIYIVADVLGHKDVNTTKRHYAAISDDIRRAAARKVKLRENDT
ncbi:MAG: tyrosine-type recombinase/integrase [Christensenellales bacterium]|jgi:integrase/recombinase XerC